MCFRFRGDSGCCCCGHVAAAGSDTGLARLELRFPIHTEQRCGEQYVGSAGSTAPVGSEAVLEGAAEGAAAYSVEERHNAAVMRRGTCIVLSCISLCTAALLSALQHRSPCDTRC